MHPKAFIYENVLGMLNHDKGETWETIKSVFNSLGYKISFSILNSKDFGIPQNRKRIFVVGVRNNSIDFSFPSGCKLTTTMFDYLETDVDSKYYLGKKGFEFVTNPKNRNRARVDKNVIQTQKANQQFNWNGDFVFEDYDKVKDNENIMKRAYVGTYEGRKGVVRQLTHRECLRLMGFDDSFKIVVPNVASYRQTGNSMVVNVMEAIIDELIKNGCFDEED